MLVMEEKEEEKERGGRDRARRSMRWFPIVLGILVVLIAVFFLGLRTDFFARGAARIASERLLGGTPFVITFDKVEGSIVRDITLKGMKIRYRGPGAPFDLFRADELSVRYELPRLFGRPARVEDIAVTKPVLRLKADSTGSFILPSFGGGGGALPAIAVATFSIEGGHVIGQGRGASETLDAVDLVGSLRTGGDTIALAIVKGSLEDPGRTFDLRSLAGKVTIERNVLGTNPRERGPVRIALDSLAVVLDESSFVASGTIVPSTRLFDVAIDAEPISIDEIKRVLRLETSHGGEVKGAFTARGEPERFRLSGTMSGVLSGYALEDFHVDLFRENGVIRLDTLAGTFNGARVRGSGRYTLGARSALGLDLHVRGVDLSRGFVPGKKLPETSFAGAVSLAYRIHEKALAFTLDLGAGDFRGFPFTTASIRGSYAKDTLRVDEALLSYPTHTVNARGTLARGRDVSFLFDVDCTAADSLFEYFHIEAYRGDARLNGRWEGTLDDWNIRMNGTFGNLVYHVARVGQGEIRLAIEKAHSAYTVLVDLDGPACSIGPARFTAISLSLESRNRVTTIKRLLLAGKDEKVELAAEIRREGVETAIHVKDCSIDALGSTWLGGGAFSVFVGDTVVRLDDVQLHSREGALYASGDVGMASKTVRGRLSFERLGLELLDRAGLAKTPLAGKIRGEVRCSGRYDDPDLGVDLAMEGGKIDTFVLDTLRLAADLTGGRCRIDSLVIASPSGSVRLGGTVDGLTVAGLRRDAGRALRGATVSVAASCGNLDVAPLFGMAGLRAVSAGRMSGSIELADSLAHPLVSFKGRIERISISSVRIPSLEGDLTIDRGGLSASGTVRVSKSHEGSFRGAVPLVRAPFLYSLDREGPVSFEIDLPDGDLRELVDVTDLVAEGGGRYSGKLTVGGTAGSPHLFGDLRLRNASFRLAGMEERYNGVNATIQLADTLITVKEFTGREGKKGTISASGWVVLRGWKPAEYRLSVVANDFLLASLDNVLAIVSGTVNIGTRTVGGRGIPIISGSCVVKEGEISYDLGNLSSSAGGGAVVEPSWLAAIDLKVPGNTWIRTPDARVELQGDITLYHDGKGTYIRGELDLIRGWYNIYSNKFTITSGKLQFVTAGSFRPVVDVEAETKDPEGRTIYLTLQWHEDDLQPRLTLRHEDPGYSETDIWKMLGGGVVPAEGQAASWNARTTAQGLAANYIERLLNSQMEGLTIEVESGRSEGETPSSQPNLLDTRIAIGKYLSEGLYVKYKQGLSISSAREIEVEYRISSHFLLRSEMIRYFDRAITGNNPQTADEINVDLKVRWEF
jgi:hypothetical protein